MKSEFAEKQDIGVSTVEKHKSSSCRRYVCLKKKGEKMCSPPSQAFTLTSQIPFIFLSLFFFFSTVLGGGMKWITRIGRTIILDKYLL